MWKRNFNLLKQMTKVFLIFNPLESLICSHKTQSTIFTECEFDNPSLVDLICNLTFRGAFLATVEVLYLANLESFQRTIAYN